MDLVVYRSWRPIAKSQRHGHNASPREEKYHAVDCRRGFEIFAGYFPKGVYLVRGVFHCLGPGSAVYTGTNSWVVSELLTQQGPGDIVVICNARNIVPSCGSTSGSVTAAIEYVIVALGAWSEAAPIVMP